MAAHKFHVLAVPCKVFAVKFRIINRYILTFPETVFGCDFGVVDFYVFAILKHVFRIGLQTVHIYIFAEHERICTLVKLDVSDFQPVNFPECFVGIGYFHVFEFQIPHFAEKLRSVNHTIPHHHVIAIPYCRTASRCKIAILYHTSVNVPPRIFAVEL